MKLNQLITMIISVIISVQSFAQGKITDYKNAERYLPGNIEKLTENLWISPNWIDNHKFWYKRELNGKKEFFMVNASKGKKKVLFNHKKLAKSLSKIAGKTINPDSLPFNKLKYDSKKRSISFKFEKKKYSVSLRNYKIKEVEKDQKKESDLSPDGKWKVIRENHNLFLKSVETGEKYTLTEDGEKEDAYATPLPSSYTMVKQQTEDISQYVDVIWSPDSKYLISYKLNKKNCGKMPLVQAVPPKGVRPKFFEFAYPLPGDTIIPKATQYIFEVSTRKKIMVNAKPITLMYYGRPWWGTWFDSENNFYYRETARGFGNVKIQKVDYTTGDVKTIIEETSDTYVDPNIWTVNILGDASDIIVNSERDGWNHLYLYNGKTGQLKNKITKGEWFMRNIEKVDEKNRKIYFAASGREEGVNIYYRQLYSVNFDGTGFKQLTSENATHSFKFSPDGKYFIDNYSTVDKTPKVVLKSSETGKTILHLETGNIEKLLKSGWKAPEQFKAKARDGKTDIYGVIYRPSTFDETKTYPVIEQIYTGPHNFFTPKSFWGYSSHAQSFAELGFIVVQIDGMGTGKRSRKFHEKSYKNLKDGGLPDHMAAIKQMAAKYPYMDISKVGIYGFSAGGYDVVNAMLSYPDFYKVGISASGNHDHRMDKTWWNELWMGYPVKEHYVEQSNLTHAHKLKGKLLLAHGELDNNVNPYCTVRLIDALIKANKDFDYLYVPNQFHFLYDSKYYVRKRWDYFVEHLLGVRPPREYEIGEE